MKRFSADFVWGLVVGAGTVVLVACFAVAGPVFASPGPWSQEGPAVSSSQPEPGNSSAVGSSEPQENATTGSSEAEEEQAANQPDESAVSTSTDKSTSSADLDLDQVLEGVPSDSQQDPVWIRRIRYTDAETATDFLVVEGGGHGKLSDCEADFETQMVDVARKYVDQVVDQPEAWMSLKLTPELLRRYLVEDHQFIKSRENEFGVTYLKYGQLAFTEDFRSWVRSQHREVQQQQRLQVWMIGAGGILGLLALGTVVLRTRGRCCR